MDRSLALGGFMGTGKSTIGLLIAELAGVPFVDLDARIAARFGPVSELIRMQGEPAFRAIEASELARALDGGVCVLATGGGAWVSEANRVRLREAALCVVLTAPLDVLRQRVAGTDRPLWDDAVDARFASRREAYLDADLVVDTASASPIEIAQRVYAFWRHHGGGEPAPS